jgi:hypothetical protein
LLRGGGSGGFCKRFSPRRRFGRRHVLLVRRPLPRPHFGGVVRVRALRKRVPRSPEPLRRRGRRRFRFGAARRRCFG